MRSAEDKETGGVSEEAGFDRPNVSPKVSTQFMVIKQSIYCHPLQVGINRT